MKNYEKGLLKVIEEMRLGTRKKNLDSLLDDFSTDILVILDTIYYDTIKFDSNIKKVIFNVSFKSHKNKLILIQLIDRFYFILGRRRERRRNYNHQCKIIIV